MRELFLFDLNPLIARAADYLPIPILSNSQVNDELGSWLLYEVENWKISVFHFVLLCKIICFIPAIFCVSDVLFEVLVLSFPQSSIVTWLLSPPLMFNQIGISIRFISDSYDGFFQPFISILLGIICFEAVQIPEEIRVIFSKESLKWTTHRIRAFVLWKWILFLWVLPVLIESILIAMDGEKLLHLTEIPLWLVACTAFSTFSIILTLYIFLPKMFSRAFIIVAIAYLFAVTATLLTGKIVNGLDSIWFVVIVPGGMYIIAILLHGFVISSCNSVVRAKVMKQLNNST